MASENDGSAGGSVAGTAGLATGLVPYPDIVSTLLGDLRHGHYQPGAWARFLGDSWHISARTAQDHPQLVRSWRHTSVGLVMTEATLLGAEALLGGEAGRSIVRRAAPGAALCLAYTLADAYVHLGMNQGTHGAPLNDTLGLPTILTMTRGMVAGVLSGHLLGGAPAPPRLTHAALATAGITDLADGYFARRLRRTTRLGAYLDSEADVAIGLAFALTLAARRALPGWLVAGILARWLVPLAYALFRTFGQASHVPISATLPGKAAGLAQSATFALALLPAHVAEWASGLRRALHLVTAGLLVAAPLAQFVRTWRNA